MKEFTSHLCTFMGREENLNMLLRYVERALEIDALDNYWMIDMTRNHDDHELIYREQQRLNERFPGRVHIYNREKRAEELKDIDAIKQGVGSWKTFYEFLTRFNDNDVIAKCDDDTLYFDAETLRGAFEFRWKHKQPYLMHANCINNGVTCYHQHKQNMWDTQETHLYPSCGLTGPLFSFPEIACEHHIKFAEQLTQDESTVEQYRLNKNIAFAQRVSINFIFMLGSDRDSLSTIDLQDEYETSSKKPQQQDRCNCIIGDFVVVHHTYGVQEPVMEELGTIEKYSSLADSIFSKPCSHENKPICMDLGVTSSIKNQDDRYLAVHPATNNTYVIEHQKSGKFIGCKFNKKEKIRFDKDRNKVSTGNFMLENQLEARDDINSAVLWELDMNSDSTLLEFNNSNKILRTGGSRKELAENSKPGKNFFAGHMIAKFFQGGYKTELVNFIEQSEGGYTIQSKNHPEYYLRAAINKKTGKLNTRYEKTDKPEKFILHSKQQHNGKVVTIDINRCDDDVMNDGTTYTILETQEVIEKPREYYWMVDQYIWEFVQHQDVYHIKLVADNRDDMYLNVAADGICTTDVPGDWKIDNNTIQHVDTGLYLSFDDTFTTSENPSPLVFKS